MVQLSQPHMTTGKTIALTRQTFVGKIMCLFFNMLSRLIIAFLLRSKHLLMSWRQSPSAVILEPEKIKSHRFRCFPIYLPWSDGNKCHDLSFLNVELKPLFHSSFLLLSRGSLVLSLLFCHKGSVICISEVIDISPSNLDSSFCFIQPGILNDVLCM